MCPEHEGADRSVPCFSLGGNGNGPQRVRPCGVSPPVKGKGQAFLRIPRICCTGARKAKCALFAVDRAGTLAELLPAVQQLPAADKIKLIRILAEKLDEGEDISPLVPTRCTNCRRLTARWERPRRSCRLCGLPTKTPGKADAIQLLHDCSRTT